jgi:hypothetical protein
VTGRESHATEPDLCPTVPIPLAHAGAPIGTAETRAARWGMSAVAELQTQPIMIPDAGPLPSPTTEDAETKSTGGIGEGLALSISSALGALAGLASWLIAARLLPQAEVGHAAAVVSGTRHGSDR